MINWISISDRLPDPYQEVVVKATQRHSSREDGQSAAYSAMDRLDIDWLEPCEGLGLVFAENKGKVTHWAPLSELNL